MSAPQTDRTWPHPAVVADLAALREATPLTHCITNVVVSNFTANVLLATGASPAMVHAPEEVADLAGVAGGLLVNLGTVTAEQGEAARVAVRAANAAGVPWVLDPVAVGPLSMRTALAQELVAQGPAVVRANASEVLALAGAAGLDAARGVDSAHGPEAALDAARELSARTGAVVAVSGPTDHLVGADALVTVPGGDALLTRVTGAGCALGALVAAFCAVSGSPLHAATAAHVVVATAAERAASAARGPGSFAVALLDELSRLEAPAA